MDEIYNRHYIAMDDQGRIASGWSDGPHAGRAPTDADICINDKGGYQFRLKFADGLSEENPALFDFAHGIPLYKWDGVQVLRRTAAEIEADIAALPETAAAPSAQDDTDSMLVDHEYRITLLELGITE